MLEYMRHASGVWWIRLEANTEDIVLVFSCYVQIVGARLVVLEEQCRQLQLRDVLGALEGEAMEASTRLRETGEVCDGGVASCGRLADGT